MSIEEEALYSRNLPYFILLPTGAKVCKNPAARLNSTIEK
jgi:hypothetical protein